MRGVWRYFETVRYLQPVQIYGRLWFKLFRPWPDARPAPACRVPTGRLITPVQRPAMMTGRCRFRFLSVEREIRDATDWDDPAVEALWRYHLHYFDDLTAEGALDRGAWHAEILQRWLAENPMGEGVGWDPYPTSLRIVNWVKWLCWSAPEVSEEIADDVRQRMVSSLAVQARWLRKRLEHHLLGNHLIANAKALVFAGCFFDGAEAKRWRHVGERLLRRELGEQILPDGGHFERSPMYHAIILEDLLDIVSLNSGYPDVIDQELVKSIKGRLPEMVGFLRGVCHPDGEIGFFNDAAMGMAPAPVRLVEYAKRLGITWVEPKRGITYWPDTGFIRLHVGEAVMLMDLGSVGPSYLPGHAHAGTLSFELSLDGQRVIVNSGTSVYGKSPQRHVERSTAAHNTVEINGENSSEVWGGFRVARRARVREVTTGRSTGGGYFVEAWHDGYTRLPGQPVHRRRIELSESAIQCVDTVVGKHRESTGYFHFHPAVRVVALSTASGFAKLKSSSELRWYLSSGKGEVVDHRWCSEFGRLESSKTIKVNIPCSDGCLFTLDFDTR
mgnify:CR=1 FL=1